MNALRRAGERGKVKVLTIVLLLFVAASGYVGYKFVPVYLEKSRVNRLVKMAANQWLNVNPDLEVVKRDLQIALDQAGISRVHAKDVNFAKIDDHTVEAWVSYKVKITYFTKSIKPTKLKFKVRHKVKQTITTEG